MFKYFIAIEKHSLNLCGKIAIEKEIISYMQLLEGLQLQHKQPHKKIGEILCELSYTTTEKWEEVLREQKTFLDAPVMWPYIPVFALKTLLNRRGQIAQLTLDKLNELPKSHNIQQLLIAENILSENHCKKILQNLRIENWHCVTCLRKYQIFDYHGEEKISCPVCWESSLEMSNIYVTSSGDRRKKSVVTEAPDKITMSSQTKQDKLPAANTPQTQSSDKAKVVQVQLMNCEEIIEVSDGELQKNFQERPKKLSQHYTRKTLPISIFLWIAIIPLAQLYLSYRDYEPTTQKTPIVLDLDPPKQKVAPKANVPKYDEGKAFTKIANMLKVKNIAATRLYHCLKNIEGACKRQSDYLGDYYHLRGRVLFYIVATDLYQKIPAARAKDLLTKANSSLKKALQYYENPVQKSIFQLQIMPWMPEAKNYDIKPWSTVFPRIVYTQNREAKQNAKIICEMIAHFREEKYGF